VFIFTQPRPIAVIRKIRRRTARTDNFIRHREGPL